MLSGFMTMTTETRLTWMIFEYWKNLNKEKAIEVATFRLEKLKTGSPFFARNEYLKYLNVNGR